MKKRVSNTNWDFLASESKEWTQLALISEETRNEILNRYELISSERKLQKMGLLTLMTLGFFLLSFSIFLFMKASWLPIPLKLVSLTVGMCVTYFIGYFSSLKKFAYLSDSFYFFGTLLFGIALWQTRLLFNMSDLLPTLWFVAVGAMILAVGLRTPILHIFASVLLFFWSHHQICSSHPFCLDLFFMQLPMFWLPSLAYSLPFLVGVGLYASRFLKESPISYSSVRVSYLVTLTFWFLSILVDCLGFNRIFATSYTLLGVFFLLVPQLFIKPGEKVSFPCKYSIFAGILMVIISSIHIVLNRSESVFLYSTAFWSEKIQIWYIISMITLISSFITFCFAYKSKKMVVLYENVPLIALGIYSFLFPWIYYYLDHTKTPDTLQRFHEIGVILPNCVVILTAIGCIMRGVRKKRMSIYFSGVIYLLIWVFAKYSKIYWKGTDAIFLASVIFLLTAVALFGFAYLWSVLKPESVRNEENKENAENAESEA